MIRTPISPALLVAASLAATWPRGRRRRPGTGRTSPGARAFQTVFLATANSRNDDPSWEYPVRNGSVGGFAASTAFFISV
jgi:hypothetical protein